MPLTAHHGYHLRHTAPPSSGMLFNKSSKLIAPISISKLPSTRPWIASFLHRFTQPHTVRRNMSYLSTRLKAPNGTEYTQPTGLWINNEWRPSKDGSTITSINPTDESEITSVHAASPGDIDDAVAAARKAFKDPAWREIAPTDRGALMYKLAELVERDSKVLATIETWDNGKPYQVALNEDLGEVALTLKYYAGWADKIYGQVIDTVSF